MIKYDTWEAAQGIKILDLEHKLGEAESKLGKNSVDFARISLHSARAETLLARLNVGLHQNPEDVMELQAAIRTIRNIVG